MTVDIALIAAVGENGVIGADGGMPWRLSSDLKRFKAITMGKPIVMGRKTFESIGKALPGRANVVITSLEGFDAPGIRVARSVDDALAVAREIAKAAGVDEVMIIGGAAVYNDTIDRADRLYITHVHAAPDGDTWFPAIDPTIWERVDALPVDRDEKDSAATSFAVYERIG